MVIADRIKNVFQNKTARIIIIAAAVLFIAGAAFWVYKAKFAASGQSVLKTRTTKVAKGNFSITVSGSGPVVSSNKVSVSPKVEGTITKIYFNEGDNVKQGDLMYEMDDHDAGISAQKANSTLMQSQLSLQNATDNYNSLNVTAPFSGFASNITVKTGDVVSRDATILTMIDPSKLKVLLPFNAAAVADITAGKEATVYISSLMQTVKGKVTYVSSKGYSSVNGGELRNIEITIDNPGSLRDGMKANAEIATSKGVQSSTDSAGLQYVNTIPLKTKVGGTVKNIIVRENQYVNTNELLVELDSYDVMMAKTTAAINVQNAQTANDIEQKQLTYYKIYAPIAGTIVKQPTINVGDNVKAAQVLATIADNTQMEFSIPVDELDIAKVQLDQKVNISVDAIPETTNQPMTGKVSKISVEGTSTNGVTTYPVTVSFDKPDKLRGGMNANAEVMVASRNNALYLPVEAISKRSGKAYVWVKGDEQAQGQQQSQGDGQRQGGNGQRQGQGGAGEGASGSPQPNLNQNSGGLGYSRQGGNGANANRTQVTNQNSSQGNNSNSSQMRQYYAGAVQKQVEVGINNENYIEIVSGLKEGDEVLLPPLSLGQGLNRGGQGGTTVMPMGGMGGAVRGR